MKEAAEKVNQNSDGGNGKDIVLHDALLPVIESVKQDTLIAYLNTFTGQSALKEPEQKQFLEIASAFNLNPFKREIYAVAYGEGQYRKLSIITGYEVYLKRAERTGKMNGWNAEIVGEGENRKAVVTIYRKDWEHPFKHEAYWSESKQLNKEKQLNAMWQKMGNFMLKKVAIAQAFRLCFPDEFGGMPYTADELPDEMTTPKKADPVYIPPDKTETPESVPAQDSAADAVQKEFSGTEVLKEGEVIPPKYWKMSAQEKKAIMPEGCKAVKLVQDGKSVWIVGR